MGRAGGGLALTILIRAAVMSSMTPGAPFPLPTPPPSPLSVTPTASSPLSPLPLSAPSHLPPPPPRRPPPFACRPHPLPLPLYAPYLAPQPLARDLLQSTPTS